MTFLTCKIVWWYLIIIWKYGIGIWPHFTRPEFQVIPLSVVSVMVSLWIFLSLHHWLPLVGGKNKNKNKKRKKKVLHCCNRVSAVDIEKLVQCVTAGDWWCIHVLVSPSVSCSCGFVCFVACYTESNRQSKIPGALTAASPRTGV